MVNISIRPICETGKDPEAQLQVFEDSTRINDRHRLQQGIGERGAWISPAGGRFISANLPCGLEE